MYNAEFPHHNMHFVIVVDDWGATSGPEIATADLKRWVKGLSLLETRALHSDLTNSDSAFDGDPILESPAMLSYYEARTTARQAGMEASEEALHDGHKCNCQLLAMTDPS
jgi:hypothetical protein